MFQPCIAESNPIGAKMQILVVPDFQNACASCLPAVRQDDIVKRLLGLKVVISYQP